MIKSITVTNHLGESIKLELRFPEKSGFLVQKIEGLGPNANINSTELATDDGSIYNSARVISRNILLTLAFMDSPTIEDSRIKSYKYFPIKKKIRLLIETDLRTCEIYGYVESNEPDVFSSLSSTQISIICPDPYFYSLDKTVTIFSGIDDLFEFEFSNEFEGATFGTNTITTATAFDFKAGEVVNILGCKILSNNKVAKITTVSSDGKILSFNDGTFVESIETSCIISKIPNKAYNGDFSKGSNGWSVSSGTWDFSTGKAVLTANADDRRLASIYMVGTPKAKYYLKSDTPPANSQIFISYYNNSTWLAEDYITSSNTKGKIFTAPDKCNKIQFLVRNIGTTSGTFSFDNIMLIDMGIDNTNPLNTKTLDEMYNLFSSYSDDTEKSNITSSIEIGEVNNDTFRSIYYEGDADTGFIATIHAKGPATNVTIYNADTREVMKLDTTKLASLTGSGIIAGDDIIISTVKGDKYIKLLRNGKYTNILNCLDKNTDWFQLAKGENLFAYVAESGVENLEFRIENQIMYEGV